MTDRFFRPTIRMKNEEITFITMNIVSIVQILYNSIHQLYLDQHFDQFKIGSQMIVKLNIPVDTCVRYCILAESPASTFSSDLRNVFV